MKFLQVTKITDSEQNLGIVSFNIYEEVASQLEEICTGVYDYAILNQTDANPAIGVLTDSEISIDSYGRAATASHSTCEDFKNKLIKLLKTEYRNNYINKYKINVLNIYNFNKNELQPITDQSVLRNIRFFNSMSGASYKENIELNTFQANQQFVIKTHEMKIFGSKPTVEKRDNKDILLKFPPLDLQIIDTNTCVDYILDCIKINKEMGISDLKISPNINIIQDNFTKTDNLNFYKMLLFNFKK
jgi:hypothetical protein